MKSLFLSVLVLAQTAQAEVFGKFINEKHPTVPLPSLLSGHTEKMKDTLVITEGTVKELCNKQGCWMTLEDGGQAIRVIFKNHSFFVGKALKGRKVKTEGKVHRKVESVAEQKHYLEDRGASEGELAKVKTPKETFTFEATAVATL